MNIIDYIEKNGIYDFRIKPFNVVDGLIISQLSYLKFEKILPGPSQDAEGLTLSEIGAHELKETLFRDERYADNNRKLLDAVSKYVRFKNLYLNNFIDVIDDTLDIQFSAMTVSDGGDFNFVVFRGTDDTMTGWKEDLEMTFKTPVPAQHYSVEYLNKVSKKIEGSFFVGGHSKGGNLAVYSAMMCSDELRSRIRHVFSYDGPGFRTEILKNSEYNKIKDMITKLVPKAVVVGMLGNVEKYEVVECEKGGVLQHDPFNWIVDDFDFKRTDHIYGAAGFKADAIAMWASEMDDTKWKALTDWVFGVAGDAGITNLNDFNEDKVNTFKKVLTAAAEKEEGREDVKNIISLFGESFGIVAKEGIKESVNIAEQTLIQAKDNAIDFINSLKEKPDDN